MGIVYSLVFNPGDTVMGNPLRHVILTALLGYTASRVFAQSVQLASVSSAGDQANASCPGWMSADGTSVVIMSQATNLIFPDTNGSTDDVFVHDLQSGTTSVESVSSKGEQADGPSQLPRISATGQFVTFQSAGHNLVPGVGGPVHVFIRDRFLNITELVSVSSRGQQGNSFSGVGDVTPDGRFVVFSSTATNLVDFPPLVAPRGLSQHQAYMRDRLTGETLMIGLRSDGTPPQEFIFVGPSGISEDGRFVALLSDAIDLVPGFTTALERVYVRDLDLGQTIHVSVPYSGTTPNAMSFAPALSGDGRVVAFTSDADNLVPDDTNNAKDVFVRDILLNQTIRVNVSSNDVQANNSSSNTVHISANGRFIGFSSDADNLVADDTNQKRDGFVHDRWTGTTELVTLNWQGEQLNANSGITGITDDGRVISFSTSANNVIAEPVNEFSATYVRERWKLGDVNRDGLVNVIDLLAIINAWGPCPAAPPPPALPIPCDADVTNDNSVNVADLLLIINNWG